MKLFAIGDSITQGFMSGAAARSDLAYPALIARAMGLTVGTEGDPGFRIPDWPRGGLPVNLEELARRLQSRIGANIDLLDWVTGAEVVRSYMDEVEDYYERGDGRIDRPSSPFDFFHNMAVQGMDVADAWLVTPRLCREQINVADHRQRNQDGLFAYPSAAFYRTALNVLDPRRDPALADRSVLDWLDHHARQAQGVENVLLWLGANNALGTVVGLNITATNGPQSRYHADMSRPEREGFNLWGPDDFHAEYTELLDRLDTIMAGNTNAEWRVFIGTVPPVTVAPLTLGVGEAYFVEDPFGVIAAGAKYFKYYTYFLFDEKTAANSSMKLAFTEMLAIDRYIADYNKSIRKLAEAKNQQHGRTRYVIVDTCRMLLQAAFKRNDGQPTYDWPEEVTKRFPMVDTRFHHAEKGDTYLEQGGLFGLDGIHPSAIGQGLIAREFLDAIAAERGVSYPLDWAQIYAADTLYNQPIQLMGSIRRKADELAKFLIWATGLKGRGVRQH